MQTFKIPPPTLPNHNNFKVKAEMAKETGDRIKQQETGPVQLQNGVERKAAGTGCSENFFPAIPQFT